METKNRKKKYQTPLLRTFGTLVDLTKTGSTYSGNDKFSGSVGGPDHPPGKEKQG